MDVVSIVNFLVQLLSNIPVVGHFLAVVMPYLLSLPVVASALVGLWQAIVVCLQALSQVPGLSGLSGLAASLQADEASINSFEQNYILPILNQLSAIPLPTAPKAS
jgi:hypothetical protein